MTTRLPHALLTLCLVFLTALPAHSAPVKGEIVTTIAPIHSLVSSIAGTHHTPILLMDGATSPHNFYLKPSHIRTLKKSSILFYIDNNFENAIASALRILPKTVQTVALSNTPNLSLLPYRDVDTLSFEEHDEHHHDHHGHDHHGHDHTDTDLHFWLSADNAVAMAHHITAILSKHFPDNAESYHTNRDALIARITDTKHAIQTQFSLKDKTPFMVFHDAYHYFQKEYDLHTAGVITASPTESPSPRRVSKLMKTLTSKGVGCIFHEPQFNTKLIDTIADGTQLHIGQLDPLGAQLTSGPLLYTELLQTMADSFSACFHSVAK